LNFGFWILGFWIATVSFIAELKTELVVQVVETPLRVRYSETDRMGIVYHANYIIWFEMGRTDYCRAAGVPYRRSSAGIDGRRATTTRSGCGPA
jgi:hypothetical protein